MAKRLWNREFTLLATGLVVSYLGDAFFAIGIIWLALSVSGNPLIPGTLMAVYGLPPLLLGPFAGALVDNWNKRRLMLVTDLLRGLIVLVMFLLYKAGNLPLSLLFVGALLLSLCETLYKPALRVLVPTLVPDRELVSANSFIQGSQQFAQIVGAGLAGIVVVRLGTDVTMMLDALSFFVSVLALYFVRFPPQLVQGLRTGMAGILRSTWEGIKFCFGQASLVRIIVLFFGMNLVLSPVNVIFPIYSQQVLGAGAEGFGWLAGAISCGMVAGNLLIGLIGKRRSAAAAVTTGFAMLVAGFVTLSLAPTLPVAIAGTVILGVAAPFVQVPMVTDMQRELPATMQGRAFATIGTVSTASVPLGAAAAGAALAAWSPQQLFLGAAGGLLLVYVVAVVLHVAGRRSAKAPAGVGS